MRSWWVERCAECGELIGATDCTDLTAPPATPPTDHFWRRHGREDGPRTGVVVYAPSKELIR